MEEWRKISWAPNYSVSDKGRLKNNRNDFILKLSPSPSKGYVQYKLRIETPMGTKIKSFRLHRLVLETFIGGNPEGLECNHIDFDRTNNCISNLEWVTRIENMRHCFGRKGRITGNVGFKIGTLNINARLTTAKVQHIRSLLNEGFTQRAIGKLYGVSNKSIFKIKAGQTWKHVD